jgi:thioredoxin reductase (NADPH)
MPSLAALPHGDLGHQPVQETDMPSQSLAIIGSGPAGYTAALYAARANLSPVLFEGAVTAGGALMTTSVVENFPGYPQGVTGPDLMADLGRQAARFGAEFVREDVTELNLAASKKNLRTDEGGKHQFDAVILATGAVHRPLGLRDEVRLTGRGVSTCATCDGAFFRDREVAVVGGGDSALEEALFLTRFATAVTLIHRRNSLRASKVMQARVLAHPKITVRWNSEVTQLIGQDQLEAVTLRDTTDGPTAELEVSGLFVAIGHSPNSELVRGQLPLDEDGYVPVEHPTTATAIRGVFACGDVVDRRYRQAITAAGTGCAAAMDAEHYLATLSRPSDLPTLPRPLAEPLSEMVGRPTSLGAQMTGDAAADMSETSLAAALASSPIPVLVDFWADDCASCQLMDPVLDNIAERYEDRLRVVKLNVDDHRETAQRYAIATAPTLKLFLNGEVAHTIVGALPASRLATALDQFLR